jgi:carboxyl-terminal processing protease
VVTLSTSHLSRRALLGAASLLLARLPAAAASAPDIVEEISRLIAQNFYDRANAERLWPAIRARYADRLAANPSTAEVASILDAMLAELGASHTGHYTPDELAYFELLDIFARDEFAPKLRERFADGEVAYDGIGVVPRRVDGRTHLAGVYHGGPAARAGLLTGDEILAADDAPFDPVASFAGKAGRRVPLEVRRHVGGASFTVTVEPQRIRPNAFFLDALKASARTLDHGGHRLGYVRIWSYARSRYQEALSDELSEGRLKDAEGLVLDLRGGWGGAQPEYADLFLGGAPIMTFTNRNGETGFASFRWRRPFVVLVDQGTRSGKEVLAYGFHRRGVRLIGTRTAGALLAGRGYLLSDASLLVLAVLDVAVEGERLEGKGVAPDIEVPFHLPYAAGADPQLEAALNELAVGL